MSASTIRAGSRSGLFFAWSSSDSIVLLLVLLFVLFRAAKTILWHTLPAEDSLMLLRYANHLASGHGITWNTGDHPVEGATDFLFLLVVAFFIKISPFGTIFTTRLLLLICHLATTSLLYVAARKIFRIHPAMAAALALYLGTGPGIVHCSNGFSGPFYALMALLAWSFAILTITEGVKLSRSIKFSVFALLTGLTRPDGVLLALFMCVALIYALRGSAKQILLVTMGVFLVFGGAYFLWRFHYFGYLLPNPFYKKGGGHLYVGSLRRAMANVTRMLLPLLPIYALGLILPKARRSTVFSLIPIVGFTAIWILLTNENNLGMRFQYVVLPISLLSVPLILRDLRQEAHDRGWSTGMLDALTFNVAAYTVVLTLVIVESVWWTTVYQADVSSHGSGAYNIAMGLAQWRDRGYTMLVTEAGVIPYFSGWRAIDGWGLNDAEIVHNPQGLSEAYMDKNQPAIIMFYLQPDEGMPKFNGIWEGAAPKIRDLNNLLGEMSYYASTHNYKLAARWGPSPCNVNVWYVKQGLPESDQMIRLIRKEPYFEPYDSRTLDHNYLEDKSFVCGEPDVLMTPRD